MKRGIAVLLLTGLLCSGISLTLAAVEFKSSINADRLGIDDILIYTLTIKGIMNPTQPNLDFSPNFQVTQTSRSSEFRVENGVVSNFINFIYHLKPNRTGRLHLPPMNYTYEGKDYQTESYEVEVVDGSILPPSSQRSGRSIFDEDDFFPSPFRRQRSPQEIDVVLRTRVSKTTVFKGEPILFRVILYSRNRIESVNMVSNQSLPGFWQEWFPIPRTIDGAPGELDGKNYQTYEIRKAVLFPTTTGELTLPALQFQLSLMDDAMAFFSNSRTITRSTPQLKIRVNELPAEAAVLPVGDYQFSVSADRSTVDINDIFTLKMVLSGQGNIKTVDIPTLESNEFFKVYPAKMNRAFSYDTDPLTGNLEAEYPITFLKTGPVVFPELIFRYFDPVSGQVREKRSQPLVVNVTGVKEQGDAAQTIAATDIVKEGEDIGYIQSGRLTDQEDHFYRKVLFLILLCLPFLLNVAFLVKIYILDKVVRRSGLYKNKKLLNQTVKSIREARDYGAFSSILETYLRERMNLGLAEMSAQNIERNFVGRGVRDRDIKAFIRIKEESESAKFSPVRKDKKVFREDQRLLVDVLKRVDQKLK